jgi:hypothetical protein
LPESGEKRARAANKNEKKCNLHTFSLEACTLRVTLFTTLIPKVIRLLMQLLWMRMTLGWHVRRARKAFEKELTRQGVSKQDARRISRQFEIAKDWVLSSMWQFGRS